MLYIFDKDDNFKNIITEDTGLIDTWFKDYQNHLIDEPFVFHVDSESELLPLIVAENQVAFKHTFHTLQVDLEPLKLMRIKEVEELYSADGYIVRVSCEPSWLELYDHFIEDKRINNGTAQTAMDRALEGSRWIGADAILTGNGSTNFYWIDAVEALFKIAEEWNGTLQDYITLDENNEIALRIMYLLPRLGRDNGLLIQPDYNAETIERRTLSYPITAMYGQGASLETEGGGHTRYITFEDVEWKKSKGDPVDKPLGQKWVGDTQALAKYGYLKEDGSRMHRFGHFSNQDYETPEELLHATWQALQENIEPEIYHEATIHEVDKPIYLGDTGTILDRHYGKPIEVQSQITGLEYDILRPMENVKTVLGNYKDMSRDPLEDEIDEIKQNQKRPAIVDKGSFPNKKPMKPTNVEAVGGWETIQVTWDYTDEIYVSHYEVYASQNKDFVPDSQFLVYSGKVSAFGHEVKTDEVWYYRVCAVNYHGVKSEFSDEASASTIRIPLDATNFESIVTDAKNTADEAYDNALIAAGNAADALEEAISNATDIEEFAYTITGDESITTLAGTAGVLQSTLIDMDGNINTLTQTVNATISRIENMSGNMITHNPEGWLKVFNFIAIDGGVPVKQNTDYILTDFSDEEVDNIQVNFGGKSIDIGEDGTLIFNSGDDNTIGIIVTTNDSDFLEKLGTVYRFKLEEGTESTAWTAHDEDTYTQYSQLQDAINLRVKKGDVMSQINIEADRVLISTDGKLVLDAESTLISNAIIKDAHIESLNGKKIISKSITTDQLDVNNLSAITANLGTVTSGRLLSQNNNMDLNLNTGSLVMQNANFTLGGGANINFTSSGNKLHYELNTRRSGIAFTNAIGGQYPIVAMGVAGSSQPLNITDDASFGGFIVNARQRYWDDEIGNSVVGHRFDVRDKVLSIDKAFRFMLNVDEPYLAPTNVSSYNYNLGTGNNYFNRMYVNKVNVNDSEFTILSTHNTSQGFRMMTEYSGESQMAFYGSNAHNYYYNLGKSNRRFSYVYLRYQPDVSSDKRLKENFKENKLGLDFINDLNTITFNLKDEEEKQVQLGLIAQDVESVLQKHDSSHLSVVKNNSEYMSMEYNQLIMPTIKAVQELDGKFILTRNELIDRIDQQQNTIDDLMLKVAKLESAA